MRQGACLLGPPHGAGEQATTWQSDTSTPPAAEFRLQEQPSRQANAMVPLAAGISSACRGGQGASADWPGKTATKRLPRASAMADCGHGSAQSLCGRAHLHVDGMIPLGHETNHRRSRLDRSIRPSLARRPCRRSRPSRALPAFRHVGDLAGRFSSEEAGSCAEPRGSPGVQRLQAGRHECGPAREPVLPPKICASVVAP